MRIDLANMTEQEKKIVLDDLLDNSNTSKFEGDSPETTIANICFYNLCVVKDTANDLIGTKRFIRFRDKVLANFCDEMGITKDSYFSVLIHHISVCAMILVDSGSLKFADMSKRQQEILASVVHISGMAEKRKAKGDKRLDFVNDVDHPYDKQALVEMLMPAIDSVLYDCIEAYYFAHQEKLDENLAGLFTMLPFHIEQITLIHNRIINVAPYVLLSEAGKVAGDNIITGHQRKEIENMTDELMKEKSKQYDTRISILETKLEAEQKKNEVLEDKLHNIGEEHHQEKIAMQKRYNKLNDKYNDLQKFADELQADIAEEESDEVAAVYDVDTVDTDGKYAFVVAGDIRIQQTLKELFPNCQIVNTTTYDTRNRNLDAVVFLTGCIKHKLYTGLKGQCVKYGIPWAHCPSSNINNIKIAILKALEGAKK